MKIRIYSTDACPKCRALKVYLKDCGIDFEVRDISKHMPYLQANEAWHRDTAAPVMEVVDGKFTKLFDHFDMFDKNGLKKTSIDIMVQSMFEVPQ
jgi:glutaredoxin